MKDDGAKGVELSGGQSFRSGERQSRPGFTFAPEPEQTSPGGQSVSKSLGEKINLGLKPEELESYLDAYVIRQDQAKATLATKICTHFNRIRYLDESGVKDAPSSVGMIKNNILLIGPTGVGKTYLVKLIAQKLGVPIVKGDATKFSETGYVGGDVEDLVRDLVYAAEDDIELAQCGIIYVDEVDKICSSQSLIGPDVSRTGVQRALLKPMEETEVDLKVPHDPISQIQAIENYRKTGQREKRTVNTRHILFIMSGAFSDLEEVIKKRLNQQTIGFGSVGGEDSCQNKQEILSQVTAQDLITYGFESEFVGRLPVVVVLDELTADDLHQILRSPNNPVVLSKKRDFAAYGVELRFEDEALALIAEAAAEEKTGARGLIGTMERVLLDFEKRLPSTSIERLLVTPEMVKDPVGELERLLANPDDDALLERFAEAGRDEDLRLENSLKNRAKEIENEIGLPVSEPMIELVLAGRDQVGLDVDLALAQIKDETGQVREFEAEIGREHGLEVAFDEEAVYTVIRVARKAGLTPAEYLAGRSGELVLGLKLARDKAGMEAFVLSRDAIINTADYVGRLVSPALSTES